MSFRFRIFRRSSGDVSKSIRIFWIWNVLAPSWLIPSSMLFCSTVTAVITEMIEKSPTATPSRVSNERSFDARMALRAIPRLSRNIDHSKTSLLIAQRLHGVHFGRTVGRKETRDQSNSQRYQNG